MTRQVAGRPSGKNIATAPPPVKECGVALQPDFGPGVRLDIGEHKILEIGVSFERAADSLSLAAYFSESGSP
jgi:hypothetical protein